ncbi:MAG: MipA/OmpV family protein [Pseudomonadota bacterium]
MRRKHSAISAALLTTVATWILSPAAAQQNIDEPVLSPMIFGETEAERRDKIEREREEQREAIEISAEQSRDGQKLDEPRLDPLLFGPRYDDPETNPTGIRVVSPDDEEGRGFFSALNFLVPEETNLSLGVGPVYEPDYFGSDDYEFNADPQVFIRVRNFLFLDDDGADLAVFGFSRFRVGPSIRIRGRRDQDENPALQGLGDVGTTFEFGGFIATNFLDRFAAKARVRHGLKTGHRGTIADGTLTALIFRTGPLSVAANAQATWIGERYADAFFSVTPEQSAASNNVLSVYDANSGFETVGGGVTAYINIGDRWSLNPYATYRYIFDEYAQTPIINEFGSRNQFTVGFHLMREFSFKMR